MLKEEGKHNFQITGPNSKDFKKIEVLNYTFFQKKFTGKTGIPMEHTILANPKVYENPWPPHTNTLARGVIIRTDKQIGRGLRNQHFLQYAVVEAKNLETKEKEIVIFINAIAVPEESKGKD